MVDLDPYLHDANWAERHQLEADDFWGPQLRAAIWRRRLHIAAVVLTFFAVVLTTAAAAMLVLVVTGCPPCG